MRLIDADKLPITYDGHSVGVRKVDLDNAPTIDPVKHGRWIGLFHTSFPPKYEFDCCSKCGFCSEKRWSFCPWCGARMDEEVVNEEI